jgi:NAD(P)-dependent dehydrogenase (short-subunit alcohol dehydrogenase family)
MFDCKDNGAKLIVCDINEERGAAGVYFHADVARESEVQSLIEATVKQFRRLDVAVNNAAKETPGPTLDLPSAAFDELIDTNLKGVYYCMKHEVAQMRV